MNVKINLQAFGDSIDHLISKKLSESNLPECLGKLGIPLVREVSTFDSDAIFRLREEVTEDEIADMDITKYVPYETERILLSGCVLTKKGKKILEDYKNEVSQIVADHLKRCINCTYIDICDKITKNYLKTLELHLKN